jgi:integrase
MKGIAMNQRFNLFRRGAVFYVEDTTTGKQASLRTKDPAEANTLLHARNESFRQPVLNLQIARTYLAASDPSVSTRTWQVPMDEMTRTKTGSTRERHERAMQDKAFDRIRNLPLLQTDAAHFLKVLQAGTVTTNLYLRRIHNFALDMGWLPWPVMPRKRWPRICFKEKRGITALEHEAILAATTNPERRTYYDLLWHLGGSQSDVAGLRAEDIDWQRQTISYGRMKTHTVATVHFSDTLARLLKTLPATGQLFPRLSQMEEKHRAAEFRRKCNRLKIEGVSLHSYRYAWAERAKIAGYQPQLRRGFQAFAGAGLPPDRRLARAKALCGRIEVRCATRAASQRTRSAHPPLQRLPATKPRDSAEASSAKRVGARVPGASGTGGEAQYLGGDPAEDPCFCSGLADIPGRALPAGPSSRASSRRPGREIAAIPLTSEGCLGVDHGWVPPKQVAEPPSGLP